MLDILSSVSRDCCCFSSESDVSEFTSVLRVYISLNGFSFFVSCWIMCPRCLVKSPTENFDDLHQRSVLLGSVRVENEL